MSTTTPCCGQCRHWSPVEIADADRPWNKPATHQKVGSCEKIKHAGMETEQVADKLVAEGTLAATTDMEGYSSGLLTQRQFGCILFEKRI